MADGLRTILDHALPPCCVRIDIGESHSGSGFYVAPGVVVTCKHVIRAGEVSSDEVSTDIQVVSKLGTYRVLDVPEISEDDEDDLAVLRVEPADATTPAEHPCVFLDTGLRSTDEVASRGYPKAHPEGEPALLVNEGWMGHEERRLKLAVGQVVPGMSGSPLLNRRTGRVAGIVTRTRDETRALGGYAVSANVLIELAPRLETLNAAYHRTHPDNWYSLLPVDEQTAVLKTWEEEAEASPPELVLVLTVNEKRKAWRVRAEVYRRKDGVWKKDAATPSATINLNDVQALVARLFRDWASREASATGRVSGGDQIRLLGEILARAVLRKPIGPVFELLLQGTEHGWFQVALRFDKVPDASFLEFVQLPWEHLFLPVEGSRGAVYLAHDERLALIRSAASTPESRTPTKDRISVLVVTVEKPNALQVGQPDKRLELDVKIISHSLATDLPSAIEVTTVAAPGLHGLSQALEKGDYDVVHYVGYGEFRSGRDQIAIGPSGESYPADGFAHALSLRRPPVVVLQLCRGSETVPADLSVFGPPILREGCRGVLAYQYPVSEGLSRKFNTLLYRALADGVSLERAVQDARRAIFWDAEGDEPRAFLSPALFVQSPGGLFLTPPPRDTAKRPRIGLLAGHA